MSLRRVEEVDIKQSVGGKIFNYGRLVCTGTGSREIQFSTLSEPLRFRKSIHAA